MIFGSGPFGSPHLHAHRPQVAYPAIPFKKADVGTSRHLLREYKKGIFVTRQQFEVCVGLMLGDASLQTQDNGKTYRMKFEVGEKNLAYLQHIKTNVLDDFILGEPHEITRTNKNNRLVKTYQLQTVGHENFCVLQDLFLDSNKKKCIKKDRLAPYFTPRTLAYWFMDDGGKLDYSPNQGKGLVFNTHCFSHSEVQDLCTLITEKFDLTTWTKPNKSGYVVAISGKDYEKFVELAGSYIIPEMGYKLPRPRKS